jgi:anthranilate phosphoribosyltransferase
VVGLTWPEVLARLSRRESLSAAEAEETLNIVLSGEATPAQVGAFLSLLHAKGETAEEVTGLARAMVDAAVPCPLDKKDAEAAVDLVGTGGDRLSSINVTTLAAFITAGSGVPVCKHGNRAASSSVGTADVLEALGVAIELGPEGVARCVAEAGMGFCFAQRFHPAMRFVGPVRKELGVPTVFNFLGPLINPARIRRQLVGVSDPAMAPIMAGVFGATGSRRTLIVHADDGLDELSVTSPADVLEVRGDGAGAFEVAQWRERRFQRRRDPLGARGGAGAPTGHRGPQCGRRARGGGTGRGSAERAGARDRVDREWPGARRARRADRYVPRRTAPAAGLTRQLRRGPWVSGSSAGESGRQSAMTHPPKPPPLMRAPSTPGCASSCSTNSSTAGNETL